MRTSKSYPKHKHFIRSLTALLLSVLMVCSITTTAFAGNTYGAGTHHLGTFSFTGYNGGYFHTYNASKVRFGIAHRALDATKGHYFFHVQLWQYGVERPIASYTLSSGGSTTVEEIGQYHYFTSDQFSITPGRDYRFTYRAYDQGGYVEDRNLQVQVVITLSN